MSLKVANCAPDTALMLHHVFSSHFVTPRDTSYDFLLCLLFCSSPFPRPSVFPHHVPFYLCLFVFPFCPVALLPTLAALFILRAFGTWLHFQCNLSYRSSAFLRYSL